MLFLLVDMVSAIGFDNSGDYLAVGDRGGRVVIFERKGGKHVRISYKFSILLMYTYIHTHAKLLYKQEFYEFIFRQFFWSCWQRYWIFDI